MLGFYELNHDGADTMTGQLDLPFGCATRFPVCSSRFGFRDFKTDLGDAAGAKTSTGVGYRDMAEGGVTWRSSDGQQQPTMNGSDSCSTVLV